MMGGEIYKKNIGVFMWVFKRSKRNKKGIVRRERQFASGKIAQMRKKCIVERILHKKNAIAERFNDSNNPLKLILWQRRRINLKIPIDIFARQGLSASTTSGVLDHIE